MIKVDELISRYEMNLHPEGGYFCETYRSEAKLQGGKRNCCTGIYFLLPQGHKSHFHRIKSDEMWHFYLGDALTIVEIDEHGELITTVLGPDILRGQKITHVVKAGRWFASFPCAESAYSFVGCTVSPGFEFDDFELAKRAELTANYPQHTELIERLTTA